MNHVAEMLVQAYAVATESPDPSTQVGAVVVATNGMVLEACNTFPRGVESTPERLERPLKYSYVEHAERGCVYGAAKLGISLRGAVMYAPWHSCVDCARAIINSGIEVVYGHTQAFTKTPYQWRESILIAHNMLEEAGVVLRFHDGFLNANPIRFNGELWTP